MSDLVPLVGTIAFWGFLGAVILVPIYLRHRDRVQMQETLRVALEKGQTLPADLVTALQNSISAKTMPTREGDLRRGVVLIAIACGFFALGYGLWYGLMSVDDMAAYISGACTAGVGAIPGLIGVAYLILWATKSKTPTA
ncbi:MAG TPA: DUF6249 domain-containing protein [Caulobacteraceae bacterium]|jgi:hypothetical protein